MKSVPGISNLQVSDKTARSAVIDWDMDIGDIFEEIRDYNIILYNTNDDLEDKRGFTSTGR